MSERERLEALLKTSPALRAYSQLHPDMGARLMAAYDAGDPTLRQAAQATLAAEAVRLSAAAEAFRSAYGLTAPEARLTGALAEGVSLADYAQSAGITRETARGYLKAVFRKTGVGRQAELTALLRGRTSRV